MDDWKRQAEKQNLSIGAYDNGKLARLSQTAAGSAVVESAREGSFVPKNLIDTGDVVDTTPAHGHHVTRQTITLQPRDALQTTAPLPTDKWNRFPIPNNNYCSFCSLDW